MNRVTFLVDGFNLYHSARDAEKIFKISTKWLDLKKLCESYLSRIAHVVDEKTAIENIYYFSALAKHLEATNPDVTNRHRTLIKCFKDTGITIELNRFKPKEIRCVEPSCRKRFIKHEEKETDVAIGVKLLEIFITDECDTAVLLTGDTDLAPAVKTAQRLFPEKHILFAFPFLRKSKDLAKLAPESFKMKKKQYQKYQFSDPYMLSDGTPVQKPPSW